MVEDWNFYQSFLSNLIAHLSSFYRDDLITPTDYKKTIEEVQNLYQSLSTLKDDAVASFRDSLIELISRHGAMTIYEVLHLFISPDWMSHLPATYSPYIFYAHNFFHIIKVEFYRADDDQRVNYTQLYTKKTKANTIQLTTAQLNQPTVNKYMCIHKHIYLRSLGAKWYIPYQNNLIVLYGYFSHDHLNTYRNSVICKDKWAQVEFLFRNLDIPDAFKGRYLESICFRDFMVYTVNQLGNECLQAYNDVVKIKERTIAQTMKEIKSSSIDKQQRLIEILLMDSDEKESALLSSMIYDFLMTEPASTVQYSIIYNNIHISLQRLLRDSRVKINEFQNTSEFNEENISYEKRIQMMKAPEYVKRKALDKWKEVSHSKQGGDNNNAKAQQYLDGLLKIPFGIYKKEVIRVKFEELKLRYEKLLSQLRKEIKDAEELFTLCDADLNVTGQLMNWCVSFDSKKANPIFVDRFISQLRDWRKRNGDSCRKPLSQWIENVGEFNNAVKKARIADLKWLYVKLFGTGTNLHKKNDITQAILVREYTFHELSHFITVAIPYKFLYKPLKDTVNYTHIIDILDQIESIWTKYSDYQSKYFREAASRLDKAVYGIPDAKNQIKRLLAQWINGNDQGYVFGFEGPPGTGKTTLAKQGIAKCLKDEHGNPRPFVFIALGGSSNGSTLEGHNYTYVGSTWGRIVDGLVESKCMNPIIYIDELDKISRTEHGREIVGILTHLTDPSQNNEFMDKYFAGIKLDLSKCLIIFSYNDPDLIDKILLDRIQRIRLEPLSRNDKIQIANDHIIPEILENIGMTRNDVSMSDDDLAYILETYTYEPGMRKGKEKLYDLFREVNLQYLLNGSSMKLPFTIDRDFIHQVFERDYKVSLKQIHGEPRVGIANAMYATSAGIGGIIQVQVIKTPATTHLDLKLTGSMGDDMKESVHVAKSLALRLLPDEVYDRVANVDEKNRWGIHVHCPSLSTPKSGPSATLVFTITLLSLFLDEPISNVVSMTGESSLMGKADKIGGVDSKLHGSKKAGITLSLLPRSNEEDLRIIQKSNHPVEDENFRVILIDDIYDAIKYMFVNGEEIAKKVKRV